MKKTRIFQTTNDRNLLVQTSIKFRIQYLKSMIDSLTMATPSDLTTSSKYLKSIRITSNLNLARSQSRRDVMTHASWI